MQVIATGVTNASMDPLNSFLPLPPIVAVPNLAALATLRDGQCFFMPLETIERGIEIPVTQGCEPDDSQIDATAAPLRTCRSTSRTVRMEANHFSAEALIATLITRPSTTRLLRYRSQPSCGTRSLPLV